VTRPPAPGRMTRAQVRAAAARAAAMALEGALSGGWESLDRFGPDERRVVDAIGAIAARLHRTADAAY